MKRIREGTAVPNLGGDTFIGCGVPPLFRNASAQDLPFAPYTILCHAIIRDFFTFPLPSDRSYQSLFRLLRNYRLTSVYGTTYLLACIKYIWSLLHKGVLHQ